MPWAYGRANLGTAAALQRMVDADDDRPCGDEGCHHRPEQDAGKRQQSQQRRSSGADSDDDRREQQHEHDRPGIAGRREDYRPGHGDRASEPSAGYFAYTRRILRSGKLWFRTEIKTAVDR